MNSKSRFLLPIIGVFCMALLAMLALSINEPAALPDTAAATLLNRHPGPPGARAGLDRLLIWLALASGLAAMLLAHLKRDDLSQLNAAKDKVEIALNALPDAVIQLDAKGRPSYLNPSAEAMLGLGQAARIDGKARPWRLIDHKTRSSLLAALLDRARQNGAARIPADSRLINCHGLELEVEGVCQPLPGQNGEIENYLLQLRDVSEEREWRRLQPDLWDRDPISMLPGRCFMENRLGRALQNKRAGDRPLSYLRLSLTGIRAVYDEAGAHAGDSLIRCLGALLRAHVRDTDLLARMDEEAFAVLLANCPAEAGQRIAAGIVVALDGYEFEWKGRRHPIAARLWQADAPPFDVSLDDLLASALPKRARFSPLTSNAHPANLSA